jgi:undecaprenyl diphosphate synthase
LQEKIGSVEQQTEANKKLQLVLAISYSGKWDICEATKKIVQAVQEGAITLNDIQPSLFPEYLSTVGLPEPDLLIRTSGEQRISNFLLWQLAYTELYFTPILWPDFDEQEFEAALQAYAQRVRKFGLTKEQL